MFDPVAVIPVYNHPRTIASVVASVRAHGLPCIVVDDGSDGACASVVDELARADRVGVTLVRLATNSGKGAAVLAGFGAAARQGRTHVLQIDADGQHDTRDIPRFLARARSHPQAVVCGCPVYDGSVPRARLLGRYATHVWVWINTLSLDIRDSMCGFRVYPLAAVTALLGRSALGARMDFDSDIMVRLHWAGTAVVNEPTRVTYPPEGVSHFRVWRDNALICAMHARLFFGMLWRSPLILWRKVAGS